MNAAATSPGAAPVRRLLAALALAEQGATPGERAAAEQAIGRLVVANADAIRALIEREKVAAPRPFTAPQNWPPAAKFTDPPPAAWRETVAECLARPGSLKPWEQGFMRDILRQGRLSPKQRNIVNEIATRLGVTAEAAA